MATAALMRTTPASLLAAAALTLACVAGPAAAQGVSPDAAVLGDPDAPVTIVEYASTTCPHCAQFHATLFPHVKEQWIDAGRAKLILRPLLTAPAELSAAGFLLARCAGEGEAYFDALGDLFETQPELTDAMQAGTLQAYYEGVGGRHGVSPDELNACFADEAGLAQIEAAAASAAEDGVNTTPGFVIGGRTYTADELATEAALDAALQAAFDAQ